MVGEWPETHRRRVILTLWQIAPRLGLPFTIEDGVTLTNTDGVAIKVTAAAQTNSADFQLADGRAFCVEQAGLKSKDGMLLWSVGAPDCPGLFAGIVQLVTFTHERTLDEAAFDEFGRIRNQCAPLAGIEHEPLIENNIAEIRAQLRHHTGSNIPLPDPWGQGRAAVVLTHDVDGPRLHSTFALARSAFLGYLRTDRRERASFELGLLTKLKGQKDPYWNFENWLSLEHCLGGSSTFFFYARSSSHTKRHRKDPRYDVRQSAFRHTLPSILRHEGEIGLHVPIFGCDAESLSASIALLRECGVPSICGARAHYWATDWRDPFRSWREMYNGGLAYDLSLTSMSLGLRNGTILPMLPLLIDTDRRPEAFTVTATSVMDAYTFKQETGVDQEVLENKLAKVSAAAARHRGVLTLDWHERTFSNVGRWRGYLAKFLEIALPLAGNSDWRFMSAGQMHQSWLKYVKQLWMGPYDLGW
jgi:hypothetical protein